VICYRDKTFCPFHTTCAPGQRNDCGRALTPEVQKAAEAAKLPIAQFTDRPECYVPTGG
jgi:hypothetical protein